MAPPDSDGRVVQSLLLSTALLGACKPAAPVAREPIRVAAAADLGLAFEDLGRLFETRTGQHVSLSFGASGALAKQLSQGAPFDLFAAANTSFVDDAIRSGACDAASKAAYARGRVVVWSKQGGAQLQTLSDLARPELARIAIANPEHAPYGKAAREALIKAGLWAAVEPKIVLAENVRQALQFAETGNVDAAIVARSLFAQDLRGGRRIDVDPSLHAPIEQTLVVCRNGKNAAGARAFAALVESGEGQRLLKRYGFGSSAEQVGE